MSKFVLWSTRMQGWQNRQGTYGSSLDEAREYEVSDAAETCSRHYDKHTQEFGLVPVERQLLDFIKGVK